MTKPTATCLEMVRFRLQPGITDEAFLSLNAATAAFLGRQEGFNRRLLSKGPDGVWTDLVEWESLPLARQASEQIMADPSLAPFMNAIDPGSILMDHLVIALRID
ncbi:MAG: hypothetical protein IOC86_01830 [Aestuariivirga sp.]|nr:hypothetical protein [Aestuariivirga sp.]